MRVQTRTVDGGRGRTTSPLRTESLLLSRQTECIDNKTRSRRLFLVVFFRPRENRVRKRNYVFAAIDGTRKTRFSVDEHATER